MTATYDVSSQYQRIITDLKTINPELSEDKIKEDVREFLKILFIQKINSLEIPKDVSSLEHRKKLMRYRLQSQRLPKKIKDYKYKGIKKEEKYLKYKKLQGSFKKRDLFLNLYDSVNNKEEILFQNDENYLHQEFPKDNNVEIEDIKLQSQMKIENDKNFLLETPTFTNSSDNIYESEINLPETQIIVDIFKEEIEKEAKSKPVELGKNLKKDIIDLDLKPLQKKKNEEFSLLDYIGFVDKDN